ncbi:MAG TPA: O-antigen ligase family protein [Candidatus Acidoferrales bacterium]|nr:O-antigen ligase family protein [Candidatus Acidoferrales bacterium]
MATRDSAQAAEVVFEPSSINPQLAMFVQISLTAGLALAVLAFGGTGTISLAIVQVLFFGTAAFCLARLPQSASPSFAKLFAVPAMLGGIVLLQICPLPESLLFRFDGHQASQIGMRTGYLSFEPHATRGHFLILLMCFAGFFFAQIVSHDSHRKRVFTVSLVALGAFEAFYGLVQYLTGWQQIFSYVKKFDLEEATGTYINRNHYAGFLEMILPFSLALVFYEYAKLRGNPGSRINFRKLIAKSGLQKLILALCVAVIVCASLAFSRSRMGILAAAGSVLVVSALIAISRFHGRLSSLLAAMFIILSIGLAVWIGPGPVVSRFQSVGDEYSLGGPSRVSIWRDALPLIQHHPWLGTGLGTFPIAYTNRQTAFLTQFVNHAHNDYLEFASEMGIPAALILFVSIFLILARAVRVFLFGERDFERVVALGCVGSIVAILLHSFADFNLYIPANALLFSVILGLAVSARLRASRLGGSAVAE